MDRLWMALPGAALAGLGAVLCSMGYRHLRSPALTFGVLVLAAAGAAAGAAMGTPAFAAGLCVTGAFLGTVFHGRSFRVTVGLAAAMGGGAVGLLMSVVCRTSHPLVLCGATAAGAAVLALLDDRILTIGWTSTAGAALIVHGLLRSTPALATLSQAQLSWTLAILFLALSGAGFAFQVRSTAEQQVPTQIAPAPSA